MGRRLVFYRVRGYTCLSGHRLFIEGRQLWQIQPAEYHQWLPGQKTVHPQPARGPGPQAVRCRGRLPVFDRNISAIPFAAGSRRRNSGGRTADFRGPGSFREVLRRLLCVHFLEKDLSRSAWPAPLIPRLVADNRYGERLQLDR